MKFMHASQGLSWALSLALALSLGNLSLRSQASNPTINRLFSFPCDASGTCPDGSSANWLIQASDGNFYGVTGSISINELLPGTIFQITPSGKFTLLHTFDLINGNPLSPGTSLVEANDGLLYGTSLFGGINNQGVLFRISKNGTGFEIVHDFCADAKCSDGGSPSSLILGHDGNLYGVSSPSSGSNIFRFTPPSTFTIALSFLDSVGPPTSIIQGADGNFYATAIGQSLNQVERITSSGKITVLGQIEPQGIDPCHGETPLLQAANGDLWGMTGCYQIEQAQFFRVHLSGGLQVFPRLGHSIFLITPIQASDGNLWSVETGLDEVIKASTATGTILQAFPFNGANGSAADNAVPVVQGADGKIYGTTSLGGASGGGTVWVLNAGLAAPKPTVSAFIPTSSAAEAKVLVRGDHFIGTTAVKFHGVSASFKVLNRNFISVVVPTGATTGLVTVTNAGGTSTSESSFTVE